MMKTTVLSATLISAIVFSGASMARNIQSDLEQDLLYGNVQLNSSPSQAYVQSGPERPELENDLLYGNVRLNAAPSRAFVYNGPVQSDIESDFLYNRDKYEPTTGFQDVERVADDGEISPVLIYTN